MSAPIEFCDLAALQHSIASCAGRVLVVHHFATWCSGCVEEMPLLVRLFDEHANDDEVAFLGVTWELFMGDEPHETVRRRLLEFAAEQDLHIRVLVYTGEPEALIAALGIRSGTIPHTAVYDPLGMVVERVEETMNGDDDLDRLRRAIEVARARR
jgi:thiol-disulfide isomerase/thioredoxin